jgi:hypothetical protein
MYRTGEKKETERLDLIEANSVSVPRGEAFDAHVGGYFYGVRNVGNAIKIMKGERAWYALTIKRRCPPGFDGEQYLLVFVMPDGEIFEAGDGYWDKMSARYGLLPWIVALIRAEDDGSNWPAGVADEYRKDIRKNKVRAMSEWTEWSEIDE